MDSQPKGEDRPRSFSTTSTGSGGRGRSFSTTSFTGRHVLLAVDGSQNSRYAFDWYLENVHRGDDVLVLVHCPEPPRLPTFSFKSPLAPPVHEWKEILDEMNTRTRKLEEDYEGECITKKLHYKIKGETSKSPGEGIIRIAEEENCALIVIGTRGLGPVKRAILGSVSDYVIRNSVVPTVIIPSKHFHHHSHHHHH